MLSQSHESLSKKDDQDFFEQTSISSGVSLSMSPEVFEYITNYLPERDLRSVSITSKGMLIKTLGSFEDVLRQLEASEPGMLKKFLTTDNTSMKIIGSATIIGMFAGSLYGSYLGYNSSANWIQAYIVPSFLDAYSGTINTYCNVWLGSLTGSMSNTYFNSAFFGGVCGGVIGGWDGAKKGIYAANPVIDFIWPTMDNITTARTISRLSINQENIIYKYISKLGLFENLSREYRCALANEQKLISSQWKVVKK